MVGRLEGSGRLVCGWSFSGEVVACGWLVVWGGGGRLVVGWSFSGEVVAWCVSDRLVGKWSLGV